MGRRKKEVTHSTYVDIEESTYLKKEDYELAQLIYANNLDANKAETTEDWEAEAEAEAEDNPIYD